MSIYLDYNASAPIDLRVLDRMVDVYKNNIGNADSRTHNFGESARSVVEKARKQVANLLKVSSNEIFFTSGSTESNNIAIQGLKEYAEKTGKKHIITTAIEHKSVLETVRYMGREGFSVDVVLPDRTGRISVKDIVDRLREDTLLVSVMHVNNETGIIQPVDELGQLLEDKDVLFHVDATQSCGKLVDEIKTLKYNMLSFSAHKLMGPQGVGVLVLKKKGYKLPPVRAIIHGGQQEYGIRPGTIPVALVVGCGKACELAQNEYVNNNKQIHVIKENVIKVLNDSGVSYHINGDQKYCIGSTLNICIEGVSSEALMIMTKQYCGISNGSACTSKNYSPSYVLVSMGMSNEEIENSIRISWGPDSDMNGVMENVRILIETAKQLAN